MSINIQPIVSTTPVTTETVASKTYDTWFLTDFSLYAKPDRTFNAKVSWKLGKLNEDGSSELSNKTGFCMLEDLLSEQTLTENPEIAAVVENFLGALAAVSLRKGAIN
jgi:hypothetical protein